MDFLPKRIGGVFNSRINDQEIQARTLKRDMFMKILRESVFEVCL